MYIYNFFFKKKNCVEPLAIQILFFFKAQLKLQKKKILKKILVFNLRNKKLINQNLKNHKQKKKGQKRPKNLQLPNLQNLLLSFFTLQTQRKKAASASHTHNLLPPDCP